MDTIFVKGDVLGSATRVELIRQFDTGGQAEIWEVRDLEFQRKNLALKVYHVRSDERDDPVFALKSKRLENEFSILGNIDHRYIVKPHFHVTGEHVVDERKYFYSGLTMSFAEMGNLESFIRGKYYSSFSRRDKGIFLTQLIEGLKGIHGYNIVHNDVKPKNILIFQQGDQFIPLYSDFGISFKFGDQPIIGGTPGYMAPEVLAGLNPTFVSDVYSLGIIFCEFLTGAHPLEKLSGRDEKDYRKFLQGYHETNEFIPIEEVNSFGSPQLADLIQRMCSRTAKHRPRLGEIAVTLEQLNFDITSREVIKIKELAPNLANKFKWNDLLHKALNESEYFFFIRGAKPERDVMWLDLQLAQKRIYGYSLFRLLGSSDYVLRAWAGPGAYQQIKEILEEYSGAHKFGSYRQLSPTFKFPIHQSSEQLKGLTRTSAISVVLSLFKDEDPRNQIDQKKLEQYRNDSIIVGLVKKDREHGKPSDKRQIRVLSRIRASRAPTPPMLKLITKDIYENLSSAGDALELEVFSEMGRGEPPCEFLLMFELKHFFQYKVVFDLVDKMLFDLDSDLVAAFRTHFELDDVSYAESYDGSLAYEAIKTAT